MDLKRVVEGADPYCLVSLKSLQIDFRRKSAPFACRQSYGLWGGRQGAYTVKIQMKRCTTNALNKMNGHGFQTAKDNPPPYGITPDFVKINPIIHTGRRPE